MAWLLCINFLWCKYDLVMKWRKYVVVEFLILKFPNPKVGLGATMIWLIGQEKNLPYENMQKEK